MLTRSDVIGRFLSTFYSPAYLEIGVNRGETFHNIKAARKVAVDPEFLFDVTAYAVPGTTDFHQTTSDEYFASEAGRKARFDVIYLDGLHTFEQTLRDLMNAILSLNKDGVIIIDDVLPNSYDASLPDITQVAALRHQAPAVGATWSTDGSWMGDVYKLVFFIETFMQRWSYATVAENHGQTVLWRNTRATSEIAPRTMEDLCRLDFRDTITRRSTFRIMPLDAIFAEVQAAASA